MTNLTYSETTFRANLVTILETVTGAANIYDTVRLIYNQKALEEAFLDNSDPSNPVVQGWEISLKRLEPSLLTFQGGGYTGTMQMDYFYDVVGWYSVNDENETEKVVTNLAIEIFDAIVTSGTMTDQNLSRETPLVVVINLEYAMFAGILCHRIHIVVNPQEELT